MYMYMYMYMHMYMYSVHFLFVLNNRNIWLYDLKVLDWYPSVPPIVGSVHASRGPHAQSQVAPLHTVHRGG